MVAIITIRMMVARGSKPKATATRLTMCDQRLKNITVKLGANSPILPYSRFICCTAYVATIKAVTKYNSPKKQGVCIGATPREQVTETEPETR
jgi:hypothetical protein